MNKHIAGGEAVIVAILGDTKLLLIQETTKPLPHYWKFVGETLEPNEPLLNALWGGLREEAGLELEAVRNHGEVVEITDPRAHVMKLAEPQLIGGALPHTQHFWGVKVNDALIDALGGKQLQGDADERILTGAFLLSELDGMVDFHPKHRQLIEALKKRA